MSQYTLFADDTTITYKHSKLEEEKAQTIAEAWFNRSMVNKTQSMIFSRQEISVRGLVASVKFLGVSLGPRLQLQLFKKLSII